MAKMFLGKYLPPSMVTKLGNEITKFRQRLDESLFEAWERYKLSIDRCPNHNMLPVTQIDTLYNGLTLRHHATINAAAGGTFMKRCPEECYDLIKNITAYHNDWDTSAQRSESSSSITSSFDMKIIAMKAEMVEINKNRMKVLQINQQVKAVTHNCETCGGPHSYNDCPATVGQTQSVYAAGANQGGFSQNQNRNNQNQNFQNQNRNQGNNHPQWNNQGRNQFFQGASHGQNPPPAYQALTYQAPGYQALVHQPLIPQPQVVTTTEFTNYIKANGAILKNMQTNMNSLTNSNLELKNMFGQFMKINTASSSGSRTLPSNTITNPKEDLKGITTRSENAYQGPMIPTTSSPPQVVKRETEVKKDTVPPTNNRSTKYVQPLVVQIETLIPNSEPVSAPKPNQKLSIPYPSRLHDQKLCDKANDQKEKNFQIFQNLNFNISFADALILMPKFGPTVKSLLTNKDKLYELARTPLNEHCSTVLLKELLKKLGDPSKFLIPCDFLRIDECLALADFDASINLMPLSVWNKLSFPELSPTLMTLELVERLISRPISVVEDVFVKTGRALIDVYAGELTLRVNNEAVTFNLDQTSRYSANYNDMTANRIDIIDMACEEDSDFLLKEVNAFLALEDDPTLPEVDHSYYDTEGGILLLESFLNDDPSLTPPTQGTYLPQIRKELKFVKLIMINLQFMSLPRLNSRTYLLISNTEKFHNEMKCLKIPSKFMRFSTFGVSISWDRSRLHEGTIIYSWLSITCRNRFGTPRAIISDRDTHFCNDQFVKVMLKYGVTHRLATAYHPQISGQVKVSNRGLKRILERTVGENRASWLDKLEDALWAFRIVFKTPIGCTPYKLVYEKACHLPIELEHKAYWALKHCNYDLLTAGDHRKVQLNKLNELRDQAYESSLIYKEKTKRIHDFKIKDRIFNVGDRVFIFNSRLNIFSGKLKTRWSGPFTITQVFSYVTVELSQPTGQFQGEWSQTQTLLWRGHTKDGCLGSPNFPQ
uniref:Reverse transcriptase domain-containing protein n=1 Tax=Tanacetum cinerariifolium TaxID=118510 RepID=A0A6L2MLI2_TANCI|nr:reverse transcriptase domain-containing protein [Tanacetum cinerariifolium]